MPSFLKWNSALLASTQLKHPAADAMKFPLFWFISININLQNTSYFQSKAVWILRVFHLIRVLVLHADYLSLIQLSGSGTQQLKHKLQLL